MEEMIEPVRPDIKLRGITRMISPTLNTILIVATIERRRDWVGYPDDSYFVIIRDLMLHGY